MQPGPAAGDDATVISSRPEASRPEKSSGAGGSTVPRLLEGGMLGPFRLDRFIGGGGMGAVFQALDTTLHRKVAIKVLARQQSDDEENLRRFRNEAQSAARLDHENIGRVYAVGGDDGWHYIVLEYIEGTNLRDLVRDEGPFDPARMVDVSIQVAEALEHASQREVVHRDIKPSNIVITPAGRARIVDMGLARLHQVAGDADLTVSGMTLGTFDYISPEQARDPRAADVRSDLYSLGCTMFFMLAGQPPFAEGTMVQKLLQHQQAEPPAIDELRSDVPRRPLASRGCQPSGDGRTATARDERRGCGARSAAFGSAGDGRAPGGAGERRPGRGWPTTRGRVGGDDRGGARDRDCREPRRSDRGDRCHP